MLLENVAVCRISHREHAPSRVLSRAVQAMESG
jgi:hypothetical protein